MIKDSEGMMLARVIKFHPHDNSCDCQLVNDGSRLTGVPMLTGMVTGSSGRVDWHEPEGNDWDKDGSATRDVIAIIGSISGNPLVMGFLARQVSQMTFARKNFRVDRHASDVYSTIDENGNMEIAHPCGTFIRIAATPAHEDLSGKDFDKSWATTRNQAGKVWLSVVVANSGSVKANLTIDPLGNVKLVNTGTLTIETAGTAEIKAASLTINAPTTINGPTSINGGGLTHNGVDVGSSHKHGGVKEGTGETSTPGGGSGGEDDGAVVGL